jgi:chromosome segregation protein
MTRVRCEDARWQAALSDWLSGVLAVEDLQHAMEHRARLRPGQQCVNRAGQTLSRSSVGCYAPDASTHGVIERQEEIQALEGRLGDLAQALTAAQCAVTASGEALAKHQEELGLARRQLQEMQHKLHSVQLEALRLTQAHQRYLERSAQIKRDLGEIAQSEQAEQGHLERSEVEAARHREVSAGLRDRLEAALESQRRCDEALKQARGAEQSAARELQEAGFSQRECSAKLEEIERARATAQTQLTRIAAELQARSEEQGSLSEVEVEAALQSALAQRREGEIGLSECRDALEAAATGLRGLEEARLKAEQGLGPLRERIGELRLKQQAAALNEEQFASRLAESQADETDLAGKLTSDLKEPALVADIGRLGEEIVALGAVNLAALEELSAARERKQFLDSQWADLNQAIATLEEAIRKIDRETREQLRQTFEQVNRQFGTLFPELFGGGEARLVLTGEEILDAGVQVVAQPPGKKTSTIHLLSGGEKALTAISLVFAIFQLNPAPFCLLDEVDAPLDDTNTERFCDMVKRMSEHTQFVFISHNKITMELAQQLIGVTMQESGVSHVVEVDIEEALKLTEEAAA